MKIFKLLPLISMGLSFATAQGKDALPHLTEGESVLVHVQDAGRLFDWDPKIEGEMLLLCRDELCVPLWLDRVEHRQNETGMFVDVKVLGDAMGFRSELKDGELAVYPLDTDAVAAADRPAYHANWPDGRGFEKGQTLPDIPLMDLRGEEVRFSNFLGKQYVIYGWASW